MNMTQNQDQQESHNITVCIKSLAGVPKCKCVTTVLTNRN